MCLSLCGHQRMPRLHRAPHPQGWIFLTPVPPLACWGGSATVVSPRATLPTPATTSKALGEHREVLCSLAWPTPTSTTSSRSAPGWHAEGLQPDLLEVQVLEGEVGLHDAGGLHPGAQHVLLGGDVVGPRYPFQVVQVAGEEGRTASGWGGEC